MAKAIRVLNLVLGSKRCLPKQELSSSKRQLNSSLFVGFPFGRRTLFLHSSLKKALPQRRQPFLPFYFFTFLPLNGVSFFLPFYLFTFLPLIISQLLQHLVRDVDLWRAEDYAGRLGGAVEHKRVATKLRDLFHGVIDLVLDR